MKIVSTAQTAKLTQLHHVATLVTDNMDYNDTNNRGIFTHDTLYVMLLASENYSKQMTFGAKWPAPTKASVYNDH